jgi:hypothetical protein
LGIINKGIFEKKFIVIVDDVDVDLRGVVGYYY